MVRITSPASLTTVGQSPITVTGTVESNMVSLTLNGVPLDQNSSTFSADVTLEEGHNTIIARVVDHNGVSSTSSISISLDLTPPYITIDSHEDGEVVHADRVNISGLVNDIVRGTIEEEQATVIVNGQPAVIANRSYLATDIALNEGDNSITVTATDQVGQTSEKVITLNYQPATQANLTTTSGQLQTGSINTTLTEPLTIKLLDNDNNPIPNSPIIFRVTQGSGVVAAHATPAQSIVASTNNEGVASTYFTLGSRAGIGNHKVTAIATHFNQQVTFLASASGGIANKLTVNSGNNQRGGLQHTLPNPLVVVAFDEGNNVVANEPVRFTVVTGGGQLFSNGSTEEANSVLTQTDSDGRASVQWRLGNITGLDQQRVRAIFPNQPQLSADFTATGFIPAQPGDTKISGVVLDTQEQPLEGVTIRVDETTRQAVTDDQGRFTITEAPVGPVHLLVDGSTIEDGEYPTLSYNIVTVSGVDNPLTGPVYLVKLNPNTKVFVDDQDVILTLPEAPGFALEVPAGSATFPDGSKSGYLSVTAVNTGAVPMAPPNGMQPQLIVTIQPTGTRFDPPARLTLPNVDGHRPGEQLEMYSFDHDLEEFVAIGLGTVDPTGSVLQSTPGVGVIKAGWHCGGAPAGDGGAKGGGCHSETCECQGSACNSGDHGKGQPLQCDTPTPPAAPPMCDESPHKGNPINIANGNKYQSEMIYQTPGPFPIQFSLYYNSMAGHYESTFSGGFSGYSPSNGDSSSLSLAPLTRADEADAVDPNGGEWTHSFSHHIEITPYGMLVNTGSGSGLLFESNEHLAFYDRHYYIQIGGGGSSGSSTVDNDPAPAPEYHSESNPYTTLKVLTADGTSLGEVQGYQFTSHNGTHHFFNKQGRIYATENSEGYRHTYHYADNLLTLKDQYNNEMILTLDQHGNVTSTSSEGITFQFSYLARGLLDSIIYPNGETKQFHYEDPRFSRKLTGITDESGIRFATYQYGEKGRAILSEHAGETERLKVKYHDNNEQVTTFNALNKATVYTLSQVKASPTITQIDEQATAYTPATSQIITYNAEGLGTHRTDKRGFIREYQYNDRGFQTLYRRAAGTPQANTTTYEWHETFPKVINMVEPGNVETTYQYNDAGRLISETRAGRTTEFSYNNNGLLSQINGPRTDINDTTTLTYDDKGRLITVTNPLGQSTQFADFNAYHAPQTITDANGVITELNYDLRGRLTKSTTKSQQGDATYEFIVSPVGLVTKTITPNQVEIDFIYDQARRLIKLVDGEGQFIEFKRDRMGNITQENHHQNGSTLTYQIHQLHDELGRIVHLVQSQGETTHFTYDAIGNRIETITPKEQRYQQQFDPLNRLIESLDPNDGRVAYEYDFRDNLTKVTDPRNVVTEYNYNAFNEVTQQTSADTGVTSYTYDTAGNLTTRTDAKGVVSEYEYDALNRLIAVEYPANSSKNTTYTYDEANHETGINYNAGIGRLTSVADPSGTTTWRYNDRGGITQSQWISETLGGKTHTLTARYQYNLSDQISAITYPTGVEIRYQRDALGDVQKITLHSTLGGVAISQTVIENIDYLPFGGPTRWDWGNNQSFNKTYDTNYWLDQLESSGALHYEYNQDKNGNITAINDRINTTKSLAYEYDPLDRLSKEESQTRTETYLYDPVGNRTAKTTKDRESNTVIEQEQFTYGETNNRLIKKGLTDQTFDANGNLIQDGNRTYEYDERNRLIATRESGALLAGYEYNAFGQRKIKTSNRGQIRLFSYGLNGELLLDTELTLSGDIKVQRHYIWLGMVPVGYYEQRISGGNVEHQALYYLHTDHLGSPRVATDHAGKVAWRWQQAGAFGEKPAFEDTDGDGVGLEVGVRFAGQYWDVETGLHYNWFRDYDPGIGRYVQSDPIGLQGGINQFSYTNQHPLNYTDSDGLKVIGWLAKLTSNGLRKGAALSREAAIKARRDGKNIISKTKKDAIEIERKANKNKGDQLVHQHGHELKDSNGNPSGVWGQPHSQNEGVRGHSFWSRHGVLAALAIGLEDLANVAEAASILDPFEYLGSGGVCPTGTEHNGFVCVAKPKTHNDCP